MTKYITSEKWASVVLGHDDYLAMYALETLGLQGFMSSQNDSLRKDIRREEAMKFNPAEFKQTPSGAIRKAPNRAKAQK